MSVLEVSVTTHQFRILLQNNKRIICLKVIVKSHCVPVEFEGKTLVFMISLYGRGYNFQRYKYSCLITLMSPKKLQVSDLKFYLLLRLES